MLIQQAPGCRPRQARHPSVVSPPVHNLVPGFWGQHLRSRSGIFHGVRIAKVWAEDFKLPLAEMSAMTHRAGTIPCIPSGNGTTGTSQSTPVRL